MNEQKAIQLKEVVRKTIEDMGLYAQEFSVQFNPDFVTVSIKFADRPKDEDRKLVD